MADPTQPADDDKAAKIAELQRKMAEARAKRLADEASGSTATVPAAASGTPAEVADETPKKSVGASQDVIPVPAADTVVADGGDVEAEALTAASASGGESAQTPPPTATSDSDADTRIAAMRHRIEQSKSRAGGAASAAKARRKAKPDTDIGVWYFGRRDFLQSIGWMSFIGFISIVIIGAVRAMFPRVIYERPPVFKAGFPKDYPPGTVSEKYKDEERVWIIRQVSGSFVALLAICTHLGCTPRWLSSENKFKCPCHGSGFRGTPQWGINFEGPAPRPLERIAIHLAPDGQIEIDKSKRFLYEKGQWDDPAATLTV